MNSLISSGQQFGEGVNWGKVQDTAMALLISPVVGFVAAALLLLAAKAVISNPALYQAPEGKAPPPLWIRALLVLTCTSVSFAHGSNDGQKGMGLIVLILVGIVPATFALNLGSSAESLHQLSSSATQFAASLEQVPGTRPARPDEATAHKALTQYLRSGHVKPDTFAALGVANAGVAARLAHVDDLTTLPGAERRALRLDAYLVSESLTRLVKGKALPAPVDETAATSYQKALKGLTNFIPTWVKVAVALALGLGTMIGWKRIVVTVGEKIGKAHLTYAQGASAELVAFATIQAADVLGLPVSTTHILSSGIAGTMVANGSGVQRETVRNILLAWVLTLPVCVLLGAALFGASLLFVLRVLGAH